MVKISLKLMGIVLALVLPQPAFSGDADLAKMMAQGCVGCHNAATNSLNSKGEKHLVSQMKKIRAGKRPHPPAMSGLSNKDIKALASYLNAAP